MVTKRGDVMTKTIFVIILALVVLVVLIWGIVTYLEGGFSNLGLFTGSKNIDFIESECKLACLDMNETLFCEKERTLKFGGGNSVKGSCGSISDVTVEGYDGIPKCAFITCDETEEAVCYEEGKKVSCDKLG